MKILIVEDDAVSRKIMLRKFSGIGECTAVGSGKKALALYDSARKNDTPFDLMILDISMPDMDGIQVLSLLRKKEKKQKIKKADRIKIIMVTASMRMASIKKCISLGCNSYISKPFKTHKIYEEIENLGFDVPEEIKKDTPDQQSYTDMVAQIIKRFNKNQIELPVLPHIVKEIQTFLDSKNASIEALGTIVEKDAIISSKIIWVANSALFKGVDKVTTLNEALVRLGLKTSLSVITSMTSKDFFKAEMQPLKMMLHKAWLHSLACACFAKLMAQQTADQKIDNVFLMGIIHDIGKVLLLKAIFDISPEAPLNNKLFLKAIQDVHTVVGAVLIKKWGFSQIHIQAAELHHWDHYPKETDHQLLIIHAANILASQSGFFSFFEPPKGDTKNKYTKAFRTILKQLGIKPEKIEEIRKKGTDMMLELSDNF
jgi:putative nucleotidyltransferase with HDIG domain